MSSFTSGQKMTSGAVEVADVFPPAPPTYLGQLRPKPRPALSNFAMPALDTFPSVDAVVADLQPSEPVFCFQPQEIRDAARRFRSFPGRVLYAVKCNPHPLVLHTLVSEGITDFDVASLDEIELVGRLFERSAGQFFNNPAKTRPSIRIGSQDHGIRFYTADCVEEVEKICEEACLDDDLIIAVRLATAAKDARYTLTTKFGAPADEAVRILKLVKERGINCGISFHVGSQCLNPRSFSAALSLAGNVLRQAGVRISVLNVGGGFPAPYPGDELPDLSSYFAHVMRGQRDLALAPGCMLLCEPGRSLVANAGTVLVQVVVRRGGAIFLNDGVFGTLQELVSPLERRPVRLIRPGGRPASARMADFKVFGPTCDSNDVLGAPFRLPADTREGDWIEVGMMGAYSLSMRTRFNGFHTDRIVALEA